MQHNHGEADEKAWIAADAFSARYGVATTGQRARQWQMAADVRSGQVKKTYQRRKVVRGHVRMRCGTREDLQAALQLLEQ